MGILILLFLILIKVFIIFTCHELTGNLYDYVIVYNQIKGIKKSLIFVIVSYRPITTSFTSYPFPPAPHYMEWEPLNRGGRECSGLWRGVGYFKFNPKFTAYFIYVLKFNLLYIINYLKKLIIINKKEKMTTRLKNKWTIN